LKAAYRLNAEYQPSDRTAAGAASQHPKVLKFDFIHIHAITSRDTTNIFCWQPWLSIEDKACMVEYQGRIDTMFYVAKGCAEIRPEAYGTYQIRTEVATPRKIEKLF
jgi:hypothetical protein